MAFPRKPIVLAVDDKPGNLLALVAVLEEECDVLPANSGPEAIALLERRGDIDVVLLATSRTRTSSAATRSAAWTTSASPSTPTS